MVVAPKVVILEPPSRDFINRPMATELAARGFEVDYRPVTGAVGAEQSALQHANIIVSNCVTAEAMADASRLWAIINPYTGSELIDVAFATELGIAVGYGPTRENFISMAEATVMLLLNSLYNPAQLERVLREDLPRPAVTARMLAGKTVGIIGFGRIGQAVADRLTRFEVRMLVSAPRLRCNLPEGAEHVALETLLRQSDAVLVVCSLNPDTEGLLSRERLAQMKRGAVLVNTARGRIVDETALSEALAAGRIGHAAIDAFESEPLPLDSPLRRVPNATLTPHMAGHTVETLESLRRTAVDSVSRVAAGQPPVHFRNPEVFPGWQRRYARIRAADS